MEEFDIEWLDRVQEGMRAYAGEEMSMSIDITEFMALTLAVELCKALSRRALNDTGDARSALAYSDAMIADEALRREYEAFLAVMQAKDIMEGE